MGDVGNFVTSNGGRCYLLTLLLNRKDAKDAKGFFVGFVQILEEGFRITTYQALTGGNWIDGA